MKKTNHNQLTFYEFSQLAAVKELAHGIFTRSGGVSTAPYASLNVGSTVGDHPGRVMENRRLMAGALGVADEDTQTTWQVHGSETLIVDTPERQTWPPPKADAIVTAKPGIPLVMRFADCVPILLYDPVVRVVALAHAGWQGTIAGAGTAALTAMVEQFGSRPQDVIAGIGPSIGACCYEVGPEVVAQAQAVFPSEWGVILPPGNGRRKEHFDLWEANRRSLQAAGVDQIEVGGICTACHTDEFYSHRAEMGSTGRFGMMAVLTENGAGW